MYNDVTSQNVNGDNLYNGNIKEMSTALTKPNGTGPSVPVELIVNHYRYDQLNRISSSNSYTGTSTTSYAALSNSNEYQNVFTYDANGNIQTQLRNGNNTAGASMDDLTYYYWNAAHTGTYAMNADGSVPVNATNQLAYVDDGGTPSNYSDDLEAQAAGNYTYDEIGQLKSDAIEQIGTIDWNVYGKIKSVNRSSGSLKKELNFEYDAMGQRVMKLAKERDASGIKKQDHWAYTYYVRDAQGNVMATYKRTFNELSGTQVTDKLALDETHLYGSSRIGVRDRSQDGIYTDVTYNYTAMNTDKSYHTTTTASTTHMAAVNTATPERKLGYKAYELVNHLGNVLVTVSDRKLEKQQGSSSTIDYYVADVKSASDYSAFGAPMAGRSFSSSNYRYGFNGKENDAETSTQDYGMRIYNTSLGRFLSIDPISKDYPELTPYQFASNTPIQAVDLDGLEMYYAPDGSLLGKVGTSTEIRFVDADFVKDTKAYIDWANYGKDPDCHVYVMGKLNDHSHTASTSADDAATDWAFRYNSKSIQNKKEYSSDIYEVKIGDKTYYNYTQPNESGGAEHSSSAEAPAGKKVVANVHSHANWTKGSVIDGKDWNEDFSPRDMPEGANAKHGDIYNYEINKHNGYVVTPGGKLLKYDYTTDKTTKLRSDMPTDPGAPASATQK